MQKSTQISLYKANVSCGCRDMTARAAQSWLLQSPWTKQHPWAGHVTIVQMLEENRQIGSKLVMLPDGDENRKALLQLFAGLICQSPQLATTAVQALFDLACMSYVQYGKTCCVLLTFGSTIGHCPCSLCTIWATSHLATFCAAFHLFCLVQHNQLCFWASLRTNCK